MGGLMEMYNIQGFPTIIRFEGGEKVKEYSGNRSAESFAQFGS
jgi:hypothetical protein